MPRVNIVLQTKETSSDNLASLINLGQSSKPWATSETDAPLKACSNTFLILFATLILIQGILNSIIQIILTEKISQIKFLNFSLI